MVKRNMFFFGSMKYQTSFTNINFFMKWTFYIIVNNNYANVKHLTFNLYLKWGI